MIIAQISDTHIVAPGKLFRCPVQGAATDSERVYREFDTAIEVIGHAIWVKTDGLGKVRDGLIEFLGR